MRIMFLIGCITLLAACQDKVDEPVSKIVPLKKDTRYARILAKCKAITIDTLRVHYDESPGDIPGISDNYPFTGILLDSTETTLFPPNILKGSMETTSGLYACYCFAITNGYTGIIVRTPSMYGSMSVKLFTLDHAQDTLTGFIELANFEGDGGESAEKTSWLYRNNKMILNAYMWEMNTYDHQVQDDTDTTLETNSYYYVLDLSKPKYDTINKNAGALLKTFQAVVRN